MPSKLASACPDHDLTRDRIGTTQKPASQFDLPLLDGLADPAARNRRPLVENGRNHLEVAAGLATPLFQQDHIPPPLPPKAEIPAFHQCLGSQLLDENPLKELFRFPGQQFAGRLQDDEVIHASVFEPGRSFFQGGQRRAV